jgi:hypothetical protein
MAREKCSSAGRIRRVFSKLDYFFFRFLLFSLPLAMFISVQYVAMKQFNNY